MLLEKLALESNTCAIGKEKNTIKINEEDTTDRL